MQHRKGKSIPSVPDALKSQESLTRNNRGICFIENVVTDKSYRRLGLASRVLDMAIAFAKERHCYKVILQSGIGRTEAHKFYKHKGFNGESKKSFNMRLD